MGITVITNRIVSRKQSWPFGFYFILKLLVVTLNFFIAGYTYFGSTWTYSNCLHPNSLNIHSYCYILPISGRTVDRSGKRIRSSCRSQIQPALVGTEGPCKWWWCLVGCIADGWWSSSWSNLRQKQFVIQRPSCSTCKRYLKYSNVNIVWC